MALHVSSSLGLGSRFFLLDFFLLMKHQFRLVQEGLGQHWRLVRELRSVDKGLGDHDEL